MPNPTLLDQQRQLLRDFRQAIALREEAETQARSRYEAEDHVARKTLVQERQAADEQRRAAEASAAAQRKAEQQAADAPFNQARQTADAHMGAVRKAQSEARASLEAVGLPSLLEQVGVHAPDARPGDDPAERLKQTANKAAEAVSSVQSAVETLQTWRGGARKRRVLRLGLAFVLIVALGLAGLAGYKMLRSRTLATQAQIQAAAAAPRVAAARATAVAELPASLRPLNDRFGMEFVYVPPGEFTMGSSDGYGDERPQHTVSLGGFWIGLTEVTNAQYRPFIEGGGYDDASLWTDAGWAWRQQNGAAQPPCWDNTDFNAPDQPVVCLSWYEATAFARWLARETNLDVRLPTEAEWEKAARGTDGRTYPWGNEAPDGSRLNYGDRNLSNDGLFDLHQEALIDDGYYYTAPVGSYPAGASPYGALDMAGNVGEWTFSRYEGYPYDPADGPEDPTGDASRVVRGGSWYDYSLDVRAAFRNRYSPDIWNFSLGLRLVAAPR